MEEDAGPSAAEAQEQQVCCVRSNCLKSSVYLMRSSYAVQRAQPAAADAEAQWAMLVKGVIGGASAQELWNSSWYGC